MEQGMRRSKRKTWTWRKRRDTPLLNSLLTKANPEFDNVFLTIIGVIVLSFHLKYFLPVGNLQLVSESWERNLM